MATDNRCWTLWWHCSIWVELNSLIPLQFFLNCGNKMCYSCRKTKWVFHFIRVSVFGQGKHRLPGALHAFAKLCSPTDKRAQPQNRKRNFFNFLWQREIRWSQRRCSRWGCHPGTLSNPILQIADLFDLKYNSSLSNIIARPGASDLLVEIYMLWSPTKLKENTARVLFSGLLRLWTFTGIASVNPSKWINGYSQ